MPLARYAVYRTARRSGWRPTADDSDGWLVSMRHIAIEAGAFVVSVPQYIPAAAFPDDFPVPLPEGKESSATAARAIVDPRGRVVAGPLYGEEGILVHDCDLRAGLHAKRSFDAVGHYSARRGSWRRDGRPPRLTTDAGPLSRAARNGDARSPDRVISDGPVDLVFNTGFISHVEHCLDEPGARADSRAHRRVHPADRDGPPRHRALGPRRRAA